MKKVETTTKRTAKRPPLLRVLLWTTLRLFFRYLFPYALFIGISGGLGACIYFLARYLGRLVVTLDRQIVAGIIAAVATVLVGVVTVVVGKLLEKRLQITYQHRVRKIQFYEKFLEKWFEFLKKQKSKGTQGKQFQKEVLDFMAETSRNLILWADARVISSYVNM